MRDVVILGATLEHVGEVPNCVMHSVGATYGGGRTVDPLAVGDPLRQKVRTASECNQRSIDDGGNVNVMRSVDLGLGMSLTDA